jgi:hypothetical protein
VSEDAIAAISPYLTEHINRFGDYTQSRQKTASTRLQLHQRTVYMSSMRLNGPFCAESLPYPNAKRIHWGHQRCNNNLFINWLYVVSNVSLEIADIIRSKTGHCHEARVFIIKSGEMHYAHLRPCKLSG